MNQDVLARILAILSIAAQAAETANQATAGDSRVQLGADLAEALVKIAQQANAAHVAQVGQPIDLSLLHRIEPIA